MRHCVGRPRSRGLPRDFGEQKRPEPLGGAPPGRQNLPLELAARTARLSLSVTLALDARAKALVRAGRDVVSMAVGEPDFPAPAAASEAAMERIRSGDVRYTPAAGETELRAAIARHLAATRPGTSWSEDEVVVCHSGKHALSGALMALVAEGDEVLIPAPAWVSYVEIVKVTGARPVVVPAGPGGQLDLAALAGAVTPRTRVLMLNSPSNPSGVVLGADEVRALVALAIEHDLWILSDEIYRRLVYEGPPATSPVEHGARERTVIIDGASKAYAMTGYRIGFAAGPAEVVEAITRLHSQMTGAPNAVSQAAYRAVLDPEPPEVAAMCATFAERRDLLLGGLRRLGLEVPEPRGAFYAFPDVSRHLDERGSAGFCEDLLDAQDLCIVPGAAFECDGHVRLSYALATEGIEEALRRLEQFLAAR